MVAVLEVMVTAAEDHAVGNLKDFIFSQKALPCYRRGLFFNQYKNFEEHLCTDITGIGVMVPFGEVALL